MIIVFYMSVSQGDQEKIRIINCEVSYKINND